MFNLYRVSYEDWYRNRDQEWDFREEVTYTWAESIDAAEELIRYGKRSSVVAVPISEDDPGYRYWIGTDPY